MMMPWTESSCAALRAGLLSLTSGSLILVDGMGSKLLFGDGEVQLSSRRPANTHTMGEIWPLLGGPSGLWCGKRMGSLRLQSASS